MSSNSIGPLSGLRATLVGLWICRISVLSVLAGWLLFYGAEQAQAIFFDLHTPEVAVRHWAMFYASVFLYWMLPTQLAARVMLHAGEDRFEEGHSTWYAILIAHLPWVLALACLASVAAGQYWAFDHIPNDRDHREEKAEAGLKCQRGAHVGRVRQLCDAGRELGRVGNDGSAPDAEQHEENRGA